MKSIAYRNQGRGQPHSDGGGGVPVDLDDLIARGNRPQRRWAEQQLKKMRAAKKVETVISGVAACGSLGTFSDGRGK